MERSLFHNVRNLFKNLLIDFSSRTKTSLQQEIINERLKILHQLLFLSIPANVVCATLILISVFRLSSSAFIVPWFTAVILISLLRFGLAGFYFYRPAYTRLHLVFFMISTCLSAALLGFADSILMPQSDPLIQMIIIIIIAGITAGAVQTLQASLTTNIGFIFLTLFPLTVWLFLQRGFAYTALGLAMVTYLFFTSLVAWRGYRLLITSLQLRFKNFDLVQALSHANEGLEKTNKSLLESENRFRLAFDSAPIGMALIGLDGKWLKVNQSLCNLLGYTKEELLHKDFQTITYPNDRKIDKDSVQQLLNGKINSFQTEKRYYDKQGDVIWVLFNAAIVRDSNQHPQYFIAQIQSIDAQKKAEEQLEYIAYHDPLTGLFNREELYTAFDAIREYADQHHLNVAIYFVDLDYFKSVNDTFGHEIGDDLLKVVSSRLQSCIRSTDIAARLGGDEFILITTQFTDSNEINVTAERIRKTIAAPITIKSHKILISASIGISLYPQNGKDLNTLIRLADKALYEVKEKGRNDYKIY